MSNTSIERMLELNTRIEKGITESKPKMNGGKSVASQRDLDSLIEDFDRQVYGQTPIMQNEQKTEKYSAQKEMERLKEIDEHGGRAAVNLEGRNIPRDIVESILNNPLDLKPIDPKMDELEERLQGNMPGIKAAANILERVEKKAQEDRAKINEQLLPSQQNVSNIDYELIKTIIESTIDSKLSSIKETLNESAQNHQQYVPSMKMLNFKDNFYFIDNDDNVFVCEMKYKGKRKKQK